MNFLTAILTVISAFLITFLLMPSLIRYFRSKKAPYLVDPDHVSYCYFRYNR